MKTKNRGFVLLSTLLFTSLTLALLLSHLSLLFMYAKFSAHRITRHQAFYEVEAKAFRLLSSINNTVPLACVMDKSDNQSPRQAVLKGDGCSIADKKYRMTYLLRDLGTRPCQSFKNIGQPHAVGHVKLYLAAFHADTLLFIFEIRKTVQRAAEICQAKPVLIESGVISWLYLTPEQVYQESV